MEREKNLVFFLEPKPSKNFLGTSPFIGASQFGFKSFHYYQYFYLHPENILRIIRKAYEIGIEGLQLLPYPPVVKAVKKALDEGLNLKILGFA